MICFSLALFGGDMINSIILYREDQNEEYYRLLSIKILR